ncbi:family 78 glycoside hydrolase catalytic domain [Novosphingobium sp.]|uniref:family 78 glycoside hydrolase catalytic domain n=1 Tax=Novosphingobium sp. TaxID=1874826 RepID=UPI0038BB7F3A
MQINRREAIGIGLAGGTMVAMPLPGWAGAAPSAQVLALQVCGLDTPLALGDLPPRFSWQLAFADPAMRQTAFRILVARNAADLAADSNLLWDSGRVASDRTVDIAYQGPSLPSRAQAHWQVQVWTNRSKAPIASAPAVWETGLAPGDWQGDWLASETDVARADRLAGLHWISGSTPVKAGQARQFRWTFASEAAAPAELCLSANETTGVWLNGVPVSAPQDGPVRWTQMAVYPLQLAKGRNVIAVSVTRRVGFGVAPPVLAALLRHGAGLTARLTTASQGWKVNVGASDGWHEPTLDDAAWPDAVSATGTLPIGEPWPTTPASRLRKPFVVTRPVASARLHATALGVYEASLNGQVVDDRKLAPEFTDPSKRVLCQTYDVSDRIMQGANVLGFEVADGWYGGKFSTSGRFAFGSAPCRLLAQLEITYRDGARDVIATGPGWQIADSPVREASLYDGEVFDARLDQTDWARAGAASIGWRTAESVPAPHVAMEPQRCPPIRALETLQPAAVTRLAAGRYLVDFGQNFAGWPRLSLTAPAGTRVSMRFAEILKADGTIDQANLRTAWARDVYVAAGTGHETWEPRFTYHGFRYVELSGVPDSRSAWHLEGRDGHQDLALTGDLRVGDPVVQKFWHNAVWSQKANFFGLPTDCPQRDERLGWMGDAEVFWPAAAYAMDVQAFTARIMEDMRHGQSANGAFPDCIPPFVPTMNLSSPGWADAGIVLPFTVWRQSGSTGIIAANWSAMESYMDWIAAANPAMLWQNGRGADYGDWLSVDANPANPGDATTPKDLIGTAFWAANADMMARMATATGNDVAADRYRTLFKDIRTAFNAAFVKADGSVGNNSQTSHVLAIRFGLLTPPAVAESGRRLAADIARRRNHLSTGFLGTPHILDALAIAGQEGTAIGLLLQRSYPSWGYMVEKGATSMWERWNSDAGDAGMNSRNHYAFGAIGSFLFRRVAGIDAAEPGFAHLSIAPIMDPRLKSGGATYHSVRGVIRSNWVAKDGRFKLEVDLPAGVAGDVALPGGRKTRAVPGMNRFSGTLP